MTYYDLAGSWEKIQTHLSPDSLPMQLLYQDFRLWIDHIPGNREYVLGDLPHLYDDRIRDASEPEWTKLVCLGGCLFLANFLACLAILVDPKKDWIIISSDIHSTVWDQEETLFDTNYNYLGISPDECFLAARKEERR